LNALPGLAQRALNAIAAGQNPVKAAYSMLAPANTGSQIQAGWTKCGRAMLAGITKRAKASTPRSTVTGFSFAVFDLLVAVYVAARARRHLDLLPHCLANRPGDEFR